MTGAELLVIGSTAFTLGDAMLVAGTLAGVAGAVQGGKQEASAARYNAQVAEDDALAARYQTDFEMQSLRRRQQSALSSARSATAGRGLTAEGSPLLAQSELAAESELDALALQYSGSAAEARARSQAAADRLEARSAQTAGYVKAGTSLLTGFSNVRLGKSKSTTLPADPWEPYGGRY
jgi:hypothetical protein